MEWTLTLEATTGWGERMQTTVCTLKRPALDLRPEQVGLTLAEAKALLSGLQERIVCQQADEYTTCRRVCPRCFQILPVKDYKVRPVDTLFGTVRVRSPRWTVCRCRTCWDQPPTFSPLSEIIPQRCTPELEYLLARFSSLFPYRQVVRLLRECFPVNPKLNHATVRNRALRVAQRLENDFTEAADAEAVCPPPFDPGEGEGVLLSIDTGFVRSCHQSGSRHFEVTVGRCERSNGSYESFGFVADEVADPIGKARWQALLARQGHRPEEPLTVLSDGAEAFLNLAKRLGAKHVMDWFHVAMRFERLQQIVRGLRRSHPREADAWQEGITRAKWRLWHGQVRRSDEALEDVEDDMGPSAEPSTPIRNGPLLPLRVALWDLQAFLRANESHLVNYGARYRRGERISTAVVESRVNRVVGRRMAKKQQMRWSRRGAHLLVQIRVAVLDGRLQDIFQSWYPEFRRAVLREEIAS